MSFELDVGQASLAGRNEVNEDFAALVVGQGRDREAAERAGVSHFMTKPFSNADILASVRALAGR